VSATGLHSVGTRIHQCEGCGTALPLCEAAQPSESRIWICIGCEAEHKGVLAPGYSMEELRNVRPEPVMFDPALIQPLEPEMISFAQRFVPREYTKIEKRKSPRHVINKPFSVLEFDDHLRPIGEPFEAVCRNISAGGICLMHQRAIPSEFVVVELSGLGGAPMQMLANILRRRPLGPYHDIGAEFVCKLADSNSQMLR
jgi:hypothetical protein